MKVFKFYALMMPLALGLASLTACSNDNDGNQNNGQGSKTDSINADSVRDVTSFDQVRFLQNNIIEVDSLGNMVQRVSGVRLDKADSTVLSVGVENIAEATEMFKSWLSPDTKTETISPSTVDLKADLADGDGKVKETVYFKAATGDGDDIAEMTFKNRGVLKHFSKVKFVLPKALGFNSYTPYHVGDWEQHDTYEEGLQNWVCVKEAKNGVAGLLVYISKESARWSLLCIKNFASPSLAIAASEAMRANSNDWDTYVEYFKNAGQDRLNKSDYYWINDWRYFFFWTGVNAINLSNGDIDWFDICYKRSHHHYIQVRTFGLVN